MNIYIRVLLHETVNICELCVSVVRAYCSASALQGVFAGGVCVSAALATLATLTPMHA